MAVKLNASNVSLGVTDTVVVKSAELINTLITDRDNVLGFLSKEVSPVRIADVQVDEYGTVVITNAAFKAAIQAKLSDVAPLSNGTCGLAC
jgi:hypothetical protein